MYWRGAAHSNSEDSIGTRKHAKREKRNKQNENPISRQRGRNGCVRDFPDTGRAKRNTKHAKERHRCGQCYIAREKAEYERSLETKSITSAMGIRKRRRGNAGTASWSDRGIGQPLRQYACQSPLARPTVRRRRRKAKGNRKTVQPSALALKGEIDRKKGKS